jgi:hypothetical protein
MSRLLPKTLFAQTLLILLAGLLVSHLIGTWIYAGDRKAAVRQVGGLTAAQRVANLTRLVAETPEDARQHIVNELSDSSFRVALSASDRTDNFYDPTGPFILHVWSFATALYE